MKTSAISSGALADAMRLSMAKLQAQLADTQKEVSTGRLANVGLTLGNKTGQTVSLRQELERLQSTIDSNGPVATRLEATQSALKSVAADAQTFLDQLVSSRSGGSVQHSLQVAAQDGLKSLIAMLNTQIGDTHLFAGINTDVKPIAGYDQNPPGANKLAVDNAFAAAFGFSQSDPQVASIAPDDMQAFLDTSFAGLFDATSWQSNWSQASDLNVRSRISTSEVIDTSTNANHDAFRKLVSAYTMVADLGTSNLNESAYQRVVDRATQLANEAMQGLTAMQADLGAAQQRLTGANERMSTQKDLLSNRVGALEGVDSYEAASRLTALMNEVETSYAMTARIQRLTLLDYL